MRRTIVTLCIVSALALTGCMSPKAGFAEIQKPATPTQMSDFKDFIGSWTWEAQLSTGEGEPEEWTGSATWDWVLGGTYLHGELTSTGPHQSFASSGYWGWHPTRRTYVWWMLNDWGYPQEGTAAYNAAEKQWTMNYHGVGLDGTTSHGRYTMKVVDQDTLEWTMTEWADLCRLFKKIEMTGTYKRR